MSSLIKQNSVMPRQLKHRFRSEIISSILEVTNGNQVRRTEIQYKTYLSYNILTEYLLQLLQCDLIEYIEGEKAFKTTPKMNAGLTDIQRNGSIADLSLFL